VAEPGAVPGAAAFRAGYVALVGRTNVGKSTLLNALVGDKVAIISPRPQTTRRRLLGIVTTESAQAVIVDTPGFHHPKTTLGRAMVATARRAIPDSDLVVWVVDVSRPPTQEDAGIADAVRRSGRPVVLVMNKSDLLAPEDVLERTALFAALAGSDRWTLTIARTGHNVDRVWRMVEELLPSGMPFFPPDQLTDKTERAQASELIREAALRLLRQEVPHGIEVVITEWDSRPHGIVHVSAEVIVERESHKAIVIGAGGHTIRDLGTSARRSIEAMLESRVYLELHVKVRPGWRQSPSELRRLGFS
jgi:GTP-binding protein Era